MQIIKIYFKLWHFVYTISINLWKTIFDLQTTNLITTVNILYQNLHLEKSPQCCQLGAQGGILFFNE